MEPVPSKDLPIDAESLELLRNLPRRKESVRYLFSTMRRLSFALGLIGVLGLLIQLWWWVFISFLGADGDRLPSILIVWAACPLCARGRWWGLLEFLERPRVPIGERVDRLLAMLSRGRPAQVCRHAKAVTRQAGRHESASIFVRFAEAVALCLHADAASDRSESIDSAKRAVSALEALEKDGLDTPLLRVLKSRSLEIVSGSEEKTAGRVLAGLKGQMGTPPLHFGRILGEFALGGLFGFLGIVIVFVVAGAFLQSRDISGETGIGIAILIIIVGFVLGAPFGVYPVGCIGNQKGSFWAASGAGLLVMALGFAASYAGTPLAFFMSPPLALVGAIVGFNLTRRYRPPTE